MSVDSTNVTSTSAKSTSPSNRGNYVGKRNAQDAPSLSDTANDAIECFQNYAKERPDVVAMYCLGIGFVLGWKLKPW